MLGNLTGWHALIVLAIVLLLFGATKLPALAKSLGQSTKIFRSEMKTGATDGPEAAEPEAAEPEAAEGDVPAISPASRAGSAVPGTRGAPARWAMCRAVTLSPRSRIACGVGPIQVRPASITAWAKSAFSDRNP